MLYLCVITLRDGKHQMIVFVAHPFVVALCNVMSAEMREERGWDIWWIGALCLSFTSV